MRAAVLTADRPRLELADVADPTPGRGEVVLQVTACGICGSDLHVAGVLGTPGTILGHEIAGVVEACGADVSQVSVGAAVSVRPFTGCGACRWCAAGRADHCVAFKLVGFERPGGFAEYVAVDAGELFAVPTAVTPAEQALVEPLAVARHTLRRTGDVTGQTIAVLGAGPIGLGVIAWARTLGAARVIVSDPSPVRRALATKLGADATVDPTAVDVGAAVRDLAGAGADAVIECSGRPGLIGDAMAIAEIGGRVSVVGICIAPDTFLPWFGLSKELDVRFVIYYDRADFTDTIDALDGGSLDVAGLVTEEISLDQLPERFAALNTNPDSGKVVVVP